MDPTNKLFYCIRHKFPLGKIKLNRKEEITYSYLGHTKITHNHLYRVLKKHQFICFFLLFFF